MPMPKPYSRLVCAVAWLKHDIIGTSRPIRSFRSLWSESRMSKAQLVLVSVGVRVLCAENEKRMISTFLVRYLTITCLPLPTQV